MAKNSKKHPKRWTKFERAVLDPKSGVGQPGVDLAQEYHDEVWMNSHYQVCVKRLKMGSKWPCDMIQLSIKRLDKHPVHDWRHFQWIKNEIVGEENEAFELYPAESRLVDTSNQYWMYVFADPTVRLPVGFAERAVWEGDACGAKQRAWPVEKRPKDVINVDDQKLRQMLAERGNSLE